MAESDESSRAVVRTYVPQYQKAEWVAHAEELDMSHSEFVRTMVQAGRRGFDPGSNVTEERESHHEEGSSTSVTPRGDDLESTVLDLLSGANLSWDELLAAVTDDVEERLDTTLESLQDAGRVRFSGRRGYQLVEGAGDGR